MSKTKMVFDSIKVRDMQLKAFNASSYSIDKKNPLVIWLKF